MCVLWETFHLLMDVLVQVVGLLSVCEGVFMIVSSPAFNGCQIIKYNKINKSIACNNYHVKLCKYCYSRFCNCKLLNYRYTMYIHVFIFASIYMKRFMTHITEQKNVITTFVYSYMKEINQSLLKRIKSDLYKYYYTLKYFVIS